MTQLSRRADITRFCHVLGAPEAELPFLVELSTRELQNLRLAVDELHAHRDQHRLRWLLVLARRLPAWLVAWLSQLLFGPLLIAQLAGRLPARQAVGIAARMRTDYLADVCPGLDPRTARDIIHRLSEARIIAVGQELMRRGDYMTAGRFVDYLSDTALAGVLNGLDDDEPLLRTAYFVENKSRLDHVVRLLPDERLRNAILLVLDPARDVMLPVMSLIVHVSYALQRELGDMAASQDERVLERVIAVAQDEGLWPDVLPVIGNLSEASQRKLVNLPILRARPEVLRSILDCVHVHDLWTDLLPCVAFMSAEMREQVAILAAALPRAAMVSACSAALIGEHWQLLTEIVALMPAHKQGEFAEAVSNYGRVDAGLQLRITGYARACGFTLMSDAI